MFIRFLHLRHPYNKAGDGPEGPEARTVADCLRPHLQGKYVWEITCTATAKVTNLQLLPLPMKIVEVCTYGKKVRILLDHGLEIVVSLGMTGRLQWQRGVHSSVCFKIGENHKIGILAIMKNIKDLYFDDVRRFGGVQAISTPTDGTFLDLGPDLLQAALTNKIDLDIWINRFTQKKYLNKQISQVLLEQSIVAGIGNYLKSEILYYARIHPERLVSSLTPDDWSNLHLHAHDIIKLSYTYGGFTLATYISPDGKPGTYPAVVYDKTLDPNGYTVLKIKTKDGRSTYYVPQLQT